jgi:hypothetical protein
MTNDKIEQMKTAIAAYAGPVTQCPPGEAMGKAVPRHSETTLWLKEHKHDRRYIDPIATRRRLRMEEARRERIERRNAAILKAVAAKAS